MSNLLGLASVYPLPLRLAAVRVRAVEDPAASAASLEGLLREGCLGHARARRALLACAIAMARDHRAGWVAALERQAAAQHLVVASEVLACPPPLRRVRRLADPHVAAGRATWLEARCEGLDGRRIPETTHSLDRLLAHPDPRVARRLLAARSLKLTEALTIASRKPTTPAIVDEVLSSLRWMGRVEIREALVQNPFVEPGVALKLLPTLPPGIWRELAVGPTPLARAATLLRRLAREVP